MRKFLTNGPVRAILGVAILSAISVVSYRVGKSDGIIEASTKIQNIVNGIVEANTLEYGVENSD